MSNAVIALVVVFFLGIAPAAAQNDPAKKSGDGFGGLLKGMGQEINKATSSSSAPKKDAAAKKDGAKAAKKE